jgi:hypothetical protein
VIQQGDIVEWTTTKTPVRQTRGRVKYLLDGDRARVKVSDLHEVNVPLARLVVVA